MKHTTYIIISAICIGSIFLSSTISHAADVPFTLYYGGGENRYASLTETNIGSTENNYQSVAIYEYTTNVGMRIYGDGYYTGYLSFVINCGANAVPNNWSVSNYSSLFDFSDYEDYIRVSIYNSDGTNKIYLIVYLDNFPAFGTYVSFGEVTFRIHLYSSNGNSNITPNSSLQVQLYHSNLASDLHLSAQPVTGQGYSAIIKQSITDALHNGNLDLVYGILNQWKTAQEGYLADIELSVDDIETWLSYINSVQVSQDNKLELIRQLLSTFPSYSAQMLAYMQQIISMNATQHAEQQQIESAYANKENVSASLADGMNTPMPSVGNVGVGGYIDVGTQNSFNGFISLIASNGFIIKMFLIAITLGIVSYALYGKKG